MATEYIYTVDFEEEYTPKVSTLFSQLKEFDDIKNDVLMQDDLKVIPEKNEKEKKKKKKKKDRFSKIFDDMGDDEELTSSSSYLPMISAKDLSEFDNLGKAFAKNNYGPANDLIDKESNAYSKNKASSNKYKKEFAEEHAILYNQLKELSGFEKDVEAKYKELMSNKIRGQSKFSSDILISLIQLKNLKLSTTKSIIDLKKTIQDLVLKETNQNARNAAKSSETSNSELAASTFLKTILNHGRNDVISQLNNQSSFTDSINAGYDDDSIDSIISERTASYGRSEAADKYIEYEKRNVKIKIKRCVETGDWDFVAVDDEGCEIPDYPKPDITKMSFSQDSTFATDEYGRSYNVLNYYNE
ncbi:MAG: hypothetical protein PHF63_00390 [Herbinix sp.]|nr:hypothetical protein [Herbinix sp.]